MRRWQRKSGQAPAALLVATAAFLGAIFSAGLAAAETLPWPKTNPPQRLWQTVIDSPRSNQVLFDVAADGAAVVAISPGHEDDTQQIDFTWLDRGGTIRRRASASEKTVGALFSIALQTDGSILLATLHRTSNSVGKSYIVRLDSSGRVAYNRPTTVQPTSPGGAEFPGFALRPPLVSADGGALFVVTLTNPAPATALFLERVDARGRPLWHARFDEGFRNDGISHDLLDVRFLEGGETALLYAHRQSFALRRYGKRGAPLGPVSVLGSVPEDRGISCGALLDQATILTLTGPGGDFKTDNNLFVLAWQAAGKGKLREQRIVVDEPRPANCSLFAMDAGGAVLQEYGLGTVRLDANGAPQWSLKGAEHIQAAPGLVTTVAVTGEGGPYRIAVTRYADKAAE